MASQHCRAEEEILELYRAEFQRIKQQADRAKSQVSDEDFFRPRTGEANSVAILVKHISGNLASRFTDFFTADGEKAFRNREGEFVLLETDSRASLEFEWERAWLILFDVLAGLQPEALSRVVRIRGEEHTVLQALQRQISHYSYHLGQLVYVAKYYAAENWQASTVGAPYFNSN